MDPLTAAQAQVESLRRQLTNYAKDKASLASAKNQCKSLETKNKDFAWENEVLHQRVLKAEKDREQIYEQFVGRVREIKQKSGFKNLVPALFSVSLTCVGPENFIKGAGAKDFLADDQLGVARYAIE